MCGAQMEMELLLLATVKNLDRVPDPGKEGCSRLPAVTATKWSKLFAVIW